MQNPFTLAWLACTGFCEPSGFVNNPSPALKIFTTTNSQVDFILDECEGWPTWPSLVWCCDSGNPRPSLSKTPRGFCFLMRRMYRLEIEIQNQLPTSLNKKLKWGSKYSNGTQAKMWDRLIASMVYDRLPPEPLPKARITIVRHFWRTLDYDGLVGSMKPVVDALVTAGVLVDDRWSVTGPWIIDQVHRPKAEGSLLQVLVTEPER